MYYYLQANGGNEKWKPTLDTQRLKAIRDENPTFCTVLSVSKLVEELDHEEKLKLKYSGPFYADWDGSDIEVVTAKFNAFLDKLEAMRLDLSMVYLYATGGKGYHLEIPEACFMEKTPKDGIQSLPTIYREIALELFVDTLDLRVYSQGAGRMWRCPNKLRANGKYKVAITVEEARAMTLESYNRLCSAPREPWLPRAPELCVDLTLAYARAAQKVEEKLKKRSKTKTDPNAKARAAGPSIGLMMAGVGIKPGAGFQHIAMQLAIAANTSGTGEEAFLAQCDGLIENHEGDGNRYNTPAKRREELARMHRYVDGNPMYEFSVGAIKTLLMHPAPDLDGLLVTEAEVQETITEVQNTLEDGEPDEYADVAAGVTLSKYGIYVETEFGKRRVCAVSFANTNLLISCETGQIAAYATDVLVNGKHFGRRDLELDVFTTCLNFNKFCATLGHAYSGSDLQLRGTFMRFVEQAKKRGGVQYITKREGLDVISIPNHENPELRKPFLVWSDNRGVILEPRVAESGLQMQFLGYPDPRGNFQIDLADAPRLADWIKEGDNRAAMKRTLTALFSCQAQDMLGKMIGWYTACFWRMLFHKAHSKFPILHVVGAAGNGKTEMNSVMMSLFYHEVEHKSLTPSSSLFSIQQHLAGSASIPLMLDEYKLETMQNGLHAKMKLLIRDAYNCRDLTKGGGTRENEDYRTLHHIQLSAPLMFIAEAAEDEAAVMERVVLLTVVKAPSSLSARRYTLFKIVQQNRAHLAILGQYLASKVLTSGSVEALRAEFDPMYEEARAKYMLTEADEGKDMSSDIMRDKQNAKERTVYNYTVARFGFSKFRGLVNQLLDNELDGLMEGMESNIYTRMSDLQKSTQPEYLKVLSLMSTMSYAVDDLRPDALRRNVEYGFNNFGGRDVMELSARVAYIKYRIYCKNSSMSPLFPGYESFLMALKDAPVTLKHGNGSAINMPGVFFLDINELAKLGVDPFKP